MTTLPKQGLVVCLVRGRLLDPPKVSNEPRREDRGYFRKDPRVGERIFRIGAGASFQQVRLLAFLP